MCRKSSCRMSRPWNNSRVSREMTGFFTTSRRWRMYTRSRVERMQPARRSPQNGLFSRNSMTPIRHVACGLFARVSMNPIFLRKTSRMFSKRSCRASQQRRISAPIFPSRSSRIFVAPASDRLLITLALKQSMKRSTHSTAGISSIANSLGKKYTILSRRSFSSWHNSAPAFWAPPAIISSIS